MIIKQRLYDLAVILGLHPGLFHEKENDIKRVYYSCSDSRLNYIRDKTLIFMVDGRSIHGGLADRMKGIISMFIISQELKWKFKIHFVFPFTLTDYLVPNKYDWICEDIPIIYDYKYSLPILVNDYQLPVQYHKLYVRKSMINKHQLHVYSNSPFFENGYDFSHYFNLLFKPSIQLQKSLEIHIKGIGGDYISCTFRFQQLLGDLVEGNYPILDIEERTILIERCLNQIRLLHSSFPNYKILVTSDSGSFLNIANTESYVYIIPGTVVHMDYTKMNQYDIYEKSFLDFFMIANALKIHLIYGGQMYRSGFAKLASLVNNREYQEIEI